LTGGKKTFEVEIFIFTILNEPSEKFSSSSGVQKSAEVANDVFTSNEAKIVMIVDHYMHKFFPC
jgi:hypothetical protein